MSWSCWKCKIFCEVAGITTLSALMLPDPESAAALKAMKAVFAIMTRQYGHNISFDEFLDRTKTLIGFLSDIEFLIQYPKYVCKWFDRC